MGEVKRYDSYGYDGMSGLMKEHYDGDWVRAEDYDALRAETYLHEVRLADAYEAIELLHAENIGMVAQRMAYAGEFPPDQDGLPDTGSIHQNIRKLRAENAELEAALEFVSAKVKSSGRCHPGAVQYLLAEGLEAVDAALAKHRGYATQPSDKH